MHIVYIERNKTRWIHTFSGCLGVAKTRQNSLSPQFTESPPTQTNTYSGNATRTLLHNKVQSTHLLIRLRLHKEGECLREALRKCMYTNWALNRAKTKGSLNKKLPSNTSKTKNKQGTRTHSLWCHTPPNV